MSRDIRLQPRDRELMTLLYRFDCMRRGQLERLFFDSTPRSNDRLLQLLRHRYLRRYFRPQNRHGSQAVYGVGPAAVPVIAGDLGVAGRSAQERLRATWPPKFLDHQLALCDFYLALCAACQTSERYSLEQFLPERECFDAYEYRQPGRRQFTKETFRPDGYAKLVNNASGIIHHAFIEIDLGNQSYDRFASKIERYLRYVDTGLFHEVYCADNATVLTITTNPLRVERFVALCPNDRRVRFLFATFSAIQSDGPLAEIWQVSGNHDAKETFNATNS